MKIFYTQVEPLPLSEDSEKEMEEIQNYLSTLASPGTTVKFEITEQSWRADSSSVSGAPVTLSAPILMKAVIKAEREGYDAAILGGT